MIFDFNFCNNLTIQASNFQFRVQQKQTSFKASSNFFKASSPKKGRNWFHARNDNKKVGREGGKREGRNDLVLNFSIYQQDSIWPVEISIRQRGERWLEVWTGFAPGNKDTWREIRRGSSNKFFTEPSINHRDKPSQHRIHRILEFVVLVFDEIIDENNEEWSKGKKNEMKSSSF